MSSIDFTDVFIAKDVDEAADILTENLVKVLNVHAPWIIYQQRKDFVPWLTTETVHMMKDRDMLKEEVKSLAKTDEVCEQQEKKWKEFKALRNRVNNRIRQEEIGYKKRKVNECQGDPGKVWSLAKKNMDWASPGPPTQLEDEIDKKVYIQKQGT